MRGRVEIDCANCGVEDIDVVDGVELCSPCNYLSTYGNWSNPVEAHRQRMERLTNRRWQMRFNWGILPDILADAGVIWERRVPREG